LVGEDFPRGKQKFGLSKSTQAEAKKSRGVYVTKISV